MFCAEARLARTPVTTMSASSAGAGSAVAGGAAGIVVCAAAGTVAAATNAMAVVHRNIEFFISAHPPDRRADRRRWHPLDRRCRGDLTVTFRLVRVTPPRYRSPANIS
jgi:hypothetical protein